MKNLKIGIIGAGRFGSAVAKLLSLYAPEYNTIVLDKKTNSEQIQDMQLLQECDVVIPAVPISKLRIVMEQIAPGLKETTTVIDVCTIKEFTTGIMEELLPQNVNLISSHPLFGPESLEANNWNLKGLNLVLWPTRIPRESFEQLVDNLRDTGLNVILKSPSEHDTTLAHSQFLSLLVGALLTRLDIQSTEMNTRSFNELLDVKYTTHHDYNILKDVFKYNPYCGRVLEQVQETFRAIIEDLYEHRIKGM